MFARFAGLLANNRWPSVLCFTLFVLLLASGAKDLAFDFSTESYFNSNDESLKDLQSYRQRWRSEESLVLVIARVGTGTLWERSRFEALESLTMALAAQRDVVEEVIGVHSTVERLNAHGQSIVQFGDGDDRDVRHRDLKSHPLLMPFFIDSEGQTALIGARLVDDTADLAVLRAAVDRVGRVVAQSEERLRLQGIELRMTGSPVIRTEVVDGIIHDQLRFVPFSMLLIAMFLFVASRTWRVLG